ncbi:MAG: metallophosphoesterase [Clostridia bacterium]|nr:metallophosphoesterase [Clostridia bacterium]
MVKIVHCADTHFDSPFAGLSASAAEIRRAEQLAAFERVIKITQESKADLLLLAGDLFENGYVSRRTAEFLRRSFEKIKDTRVFIAAGNHDFVGGNNIYKGASLGENVTVFGGDIEEVELTDKKCRVYGCSFTEQFYSCDFDTLRAEDDSFVNIGVFHCAVPPYTDHNPITAEQIENSGLDYLAAGHIHLHDGFHKAGKTTYAYCGIPEGRGFDETGEKGVIVGEISKDSCDLHFVPVCKRQLHRVTLDVSDCITYSEVARKTDGFDANDLYSITLTGGLSDDAYFDTDALTKALSERLFYVRLTDETKKRTTRELGIMENMFLEALAEQNLSEEIYELAAEYGLEALAKGADGK